jgi:hypothetical protein
VVYVRGTSGSATRDPGVRADSLQLSHSRVQVKLPGRAWLGNLRFQAVPTHFDIKGGHSARACLFRGVPHRVIASSEGLSPTLIHWMEPEQ